jgi:hypothetical protein
VPEELEPTQAARSPALDDTIASRPESDEVLDAIRELSARVGGLQTDLDALRSESRRLPGSGAVEPGWGGRSEGRRDGLGWVRDLESPPSRRANVPWLTLEITFLVAVAVGAAVADLDWGTIVAVMAGAWALVALIEWTVARSERRRAEAVYAPLAVYGEGLAPDPSWFAPPIERTVLDAGEEDTGARLPPPSAD